VFRCEVRDEVGFAGGEVAAGRAVGHVGYRAGPLRSGINEKG
jgi:hypothetical protein